MFLNILLKIVSYICNYLYFPSSILRCLRFLSATRKNTINIFIHISNHFLGKLLEEEALGEKT